MEYGEFGVTRAKKRLRKITAVDIKYMRRILRKTRRDRVLNERIRVGQKKILVCLVEKHHLKMYGRIRGMGKCQRQEDYDMASPIFFRMIGSKSWDMNLEGQWQK